ncbi:TPA: helix-turn-helix transcriptional regulator [Escherichia coli]|nr:helix-turn-helix transcriptional regulator [Escherichia coli]HCN5386537.1 helix-turn-helix transcriptional regulator [Escherichia coli]HCN6797413.1 helix-turn-helix transcriptional regulator [Escherichia coli]HCO0610005.1 helix-turn-helix transcriptional regulator [Escherichia coli]HDZ7348360.1 helix-turn-helix transcriptional regulator [Escherichia coli]
MSSMDILTGRKIIWIYSSNVFFIQGVKELVADVFGKKQYVIHVYDEKHILNITSVNDVSERIFVFSDTKNHLFRFYLSLFCRGNLISDDSTIGDIQRYLLFDRNRKTSCNSDSHLQRYLSSREREIVVCMKLRMTDDEIASRFKLSKKTVSAHRRNILSKLGVKNRNELYKLLFVCRGKA